MRNPFSVLHVPGGVYISPEVIQDVRQGIADHNWEYICYCVDDLIRNDSVSVAIRRILYENRISTCGYGFSKNLPNHFRTERFTEFYDNDYEYRYGKKHRLLFLDALIERFTLE